MVAPDLVLLERGDDNSSTVMEISSAADASPSTVQSLVKLHLSHSFSTNLMLLHLKLYALCL
jgi:hypothetical protein